MHATTQTTGSTAPLAQSLVEPEEPDVETFLRTINELARATVHPRPAAGVCGATGCRTGGDLAHVDIDGVPERVLCPVHVLDYVDHEIGLGDAATAARRELEDYLGVRP